MRDQIFISYSHKDLKHLERFQEAVSPYLPDFPLQSWDDRRIKPGANWREEIEQALRSAKIAVLLVTSSFAASDFIKTKELPEILQRQQTEGLVVFWIHISHASYKAVGLGDFQAAHDAGKPLATLSKPDRDKTWVDIAEKLVEAAGVSNANASTRPRIVLLHRHGSSPDEEILDVLDEGLKQHGYEIFTFKRISSEILNQLDNHLTRADAVVPLISKRSESSEILEAFVSSAKEKAEKQNGRPRLLPVLINFSESSNTALGRCALLPHVKWNGPHDNQDLTDRVLEMLRSKAVPARSLRSSIPAAHVSGSQAEPQVQLTRSADALNDPHYIVRESDRALEAAIREEEALIRVKGSRQIGKTSLIGRGLKFAAQQGLQAVYTNFQALNDDQLGNLEALYRTLADSLFEQLNLDDLSVDGLWNGKKSPNWNLERIIKRDILPVVKGRLIWAMDEVERLFPYEHSAEFFRLQRSWLTDRAIHNHLEKLTVIISYATEAHLFLDSYYESPFNVGREIVLRDLSGPQVDELNRTYGTPLKGAEQRDRFYDLLGGHTFLSRRGLETLKIQANFDAFIEEADGESGPFADHLRWVLTVLARNPALAQAVRAYLWEQQPLSEDEFFRLRTAGVFAGESPETAQLRCRLYEKYLRRRFAPMKLTRGA